MLHDSFKAPLTPESAVECGANRVPLCRTARAKRRGGPVTLLVKTEALNNLPLAVPEVLVSVIGPAPVAAMMRGSWNNPGKRPGASIWDIC